MKRILIFTFLILVFISISSVCASDINDDAIGIENNGQGVLSSNEVTEDNLQTTEDNTIVEQADDYETVSLEGDSNILSAIALHIPNYLVK